MSIKVVDVNEEATEIKEEPPAIEEAKEEAPKEEATNEIINEPTEEVKQEPPKEEVKTITKKKASDIVECNKCNKSMTYKNLRYSHNCSIEPKPVKKQAKPKAKQKPQPKPQSEPAYYESSEEQQQPQQKPIKKKQPVQQQQPNPLMDITRHYQFLQQQFRQQKQERYKNLCMNMFSSKTKRR